MERDNDDVVWGWKIRKIEHHIHVNKLEQMRNESDDLADEYIKFCFSKHLKLDDDEQLKALLNSSNELDFNMNSKLQNFANNVGKIPDWVDRNLLIHGQLIFWRYLSICSIGLLYFSLIGGFSAPKIIKVLDTTGYLTQESNRT